MWSEIQETKRILFVHDRFGAFAGAESNILASAQGLNERGYQTAILHGPATGQSESAWHAAFPRRFPLPAKGAKRADVIKAIDTFAPDVIYVHNLDDLEALSALLDSQVPIARMVHDHNLYCLRSYKYNYFTRQICNRALSPYCLVPCGAFINRDHRGGFPLKWTSYSAKHRELDLNRRVDCLVVATTFMKDQLLRNRFAAEQIEIHPPVPRGHEAATQSNFSDRNLIIYSGQITRGKGVDILLRALAQVTEPFECLIFGEGNYRTLCEALCHELGLADRVHFQGYVPPSSIAQHYQECSVVAVSSVWPEPFGAVGLEGMRHGLPVVAFDAGGIKEWLLDGINGFLVPWMNHRLYAQRLDELLRNKPLARQLGERGRQMMAETFSFSKYMDGLDNLFTRLTAQNAPLNYS
ncbi:MAG TPA: glycosyltransferase family 4 protein [Verrucomicrobiae bacterium]|nr:glycosyltransferase family 4 protein [Verrucomicrobiae bacterium]